MKFEAGTKTNYCDRYGRTIKIGDYIKHSNGKIYKVIGERMESINDMEDYKDLAMQRQSDLTVTNAKFFPNKSVGGDETPYKDKDGNVLKIGDSVKYMNNPYVVVDAEHIKARGNGSTKELKDCPPTRLALVVEKTEGASNESVKTNDKPKVLDIAALSDQALHDEMERRGLLDTIGNATDEELYSELRARGYKGELVITRKIIV